MMGSTNKNQPERSHEDLTSVPAVEKIKDFVKTNSSCLLCTAVAFGSSQATRPMNVMKVEDDGRILFLSASDSPKNKEIELNPEVKLYFQDLDNSEYLYVSGTATVSINKTKIKELWNPIVKTCFAEGADDPRITLLTFSPKEGYYWETKHGKMAARVKKVIGSPIGKTFDDPNEGELNV